MEEIDLLIPPKFFWQKYKVEKGKRNVEVFSHYVGIISFSESNFNITKEDYNEILRLREEKIKET